VKVEGSEIATDADPGEAILYTETGTQLFAAEKVEDVKSLNSCNG
jgi:hypothetical protein